MERMLHDAPEWLQTLYRRLADEDLPGENAQLKMSPSERRRGSFNNLERLNPRRGGVMLLLYPEGNHWYFPLIRRPQYPGVHGGQVSFPGGKLEMDETDLQAALRETEEEIGVPAGEINVLGALSRLYIPPSNFLVSPFVGMVTHKPQFVAEPLEVAEVIEARLDHLLLAEKRKMKAIPTQAKFSIKAPYFDLEGHVVWGATAMMLSEFATILEEAGVV
ncbi:CoA pyrophosphatase [Roseivirga sp. BDSF3-8]|uniref:NUDIX hydrolase n=1 Tax=Roseivirga sp. BDSF3-8 TaxID=3241598 RepID=UPI003531FCC5